MTTPLLYEHPLSPYAQKNKIALREKRVAFDLVTPDGMGSGGAGGAFVAANPRAEVPTLVDGDVAIFDSTIIQDYIEERWPLPALLPPSPAARARVRMIEEVMDTQYEAIVWGMMEVRVFGRAKGPLGDGLMARAAEQIAGLNRWLERQLGDADWFNGAGFGWGDIAVVPFVLGAAGFGVPPADGSPLAAWLVRCMVCDRELIGFQRSFASGHLPENGTAFKRVARSALFLRAGARVRRSAHFPVLFRKRKHIGCTCGLTAIKRGYGEAAAAVMHYFEDAFRRAVVGSYS